VVSDVCFEAFDVTGLIGTLTLSLEVQLVDMIVSWLSGQKLSTRNVCIAIDDGHDMRRTL
jgi:hypothetical protein